MVYMHYLFDRGSGWPKMPSPPNPRILKGRHPLAPGEYLVQCPFDKCHVSLNTRVTKHLDKCRRNYRDRKLENIEQLYYAHCRYNPSHTVLQPELELHEYSCGGDFFNNGQWQAQVMCNLLLRQPEAYCKTWKDAEQLVRQELLKKPIPQSHVSPGTVIWDDPQISRLEGFSPLGDLNAWLESEFHVAMEPSREDLYRKARGRAVAQIGHPEESPEQQEVRYWNSTGSAPAFDFFENYMHSQTPLLAYPPGLSKSQRKKWEAENESRWKTEKGIFISETGKAPKVLATVPLRPSRKRARPFSSYSHLIKSSSSSLLSSSSALSS